HQRDEETAGTTIAIAERMDHLELVVQHADPDQSWQGRLVGDGALEIQHQAGNLRSRRWDKPGTGDPGDASDVDSSPSEPPRRVLLAAYPTQQDFMQFADEGRGYTAVGWLSQPV